MMPPAAPRPENPALRTLKAVVFALAGVILIVAAGYEAISTRGFVASARPAAGEVVRLNAGGAHPEVRFVTDAGQAVEYPQGGMIWGYRVGDRVPVLYNPENPTMDHVLDTFGALWGFNIMNLLMGVGFVLAACAIWREGRAALTPPPLPPLAQ